MKTRVASALLLPLLLGACASNRENLLFVETYDLGIGLHPTPTTGMVQFNIGFKATDLAVVPVAGVESDGRVNQRRAKSHDAAAIEQDAVSVFAQFRNSSSPDTSNNANATNHSVGIGRFFSTGVAAVNLARAYECGMQPDGKCPPAIAPANGKDGEKDEKKAPPASAETPPEPTILKPLIFGQYDAYGVDIKPSVETGGGAGIDFSLGYSGKNFAVMPLFAVERKTQYKELGGEGGTYDREAYSVLGQFKADQATTSPKLRLERFFATGLAAQYLSRGLQARIIADLQSANSK
ncbi:MAG: hypothetical protein L6Q69_05605 [Zoogloea sp.]|nr:hypothetical protein [Zoogloea sp.]